jgi:type I restriction enzyme S subunit
VELPLGWENPLLAEVAQINPPLDRCVLGDGVEVNFIPMRAVEPEGGGLASPEVRCYGQVKKGYTSFLSGDIIMAKITPCMENGKTIVVPELPGSVCFGSTEFHVLRPGRGIEPRWIASFLLQQGTRRAAQRAMTGGVGQMRVPSSFLEAIRIPLAPVRQQIRVSDEIDELFSDLDAGVAALERVRAKLAHYRASVLKAAVEGALTTEWRQQHPHTEPASELLKRILVERRRRWENEQLRKFEEKGQKPPENWRAKYSNPSAPDTGILPALPEGWCWATVDQLTSLVTSGSRGWKEYYAKNGPVFIRSQDIRTDQLNLRDVAHVSPPKNSEGVRTQVRSGDLLVTITGANVAKAARVVGELSEAYVSQHVGLVRLLDPALGKFLHIYAIAPSGGRKRLLAAAYGAGKPGLNLDNLRELPVPLAPIAEQEAIIDAVEDELSVMEHLEDDFDAKVKSAQALRHSILRHAFTGQLVSQDSDDEPASELLKRIAAERESRACGVGGAKRAPIIMGAPRRAAGGPRRQRK